MISKKPMGIYIHIPFCNRKCDYCDFVSYSMNQKAQELYLEALFTEIDMIKNDYNRCEFDTLYIGGGTPSIVYDEFIIKLARKVYSSFHFLKGNEFTIEVNPNSFSKEKFIEYVQAGVNRISVGVQCLDTKLLKDNGRIQNMNNVNYTFGLLNDADFRNISSDVMIGIPNQSTAAIIETVRYLIDKKVKHISVYTLQLERHTLLYDKVRKKKVKPLTDEATTELYNTVYQMLKKEGYLRYEVSNFAKPGFESRHNSKYWNETEYLGLGVSAHSNVDGYRYYNTKRLDTYIDRMQRGETAAYSKEYQPKAQRRTERIMLSLRTAKGLDIEKFNEDFKEDIMRSRAEQIRRLMEQGVLIEEKGFLKITEPYFYVSNSIIVDLL